MLFTDEELRDFIRRNSWTFAKTMPEHPHEYAVRGRVRDDRAFDAFVQTIRARGTKRRWGRATYTYLALDGLEYWTMGAPIDQTIIINRARIAP